MGGYDIDLVILTDLDVLLGNYLLSKPAEFTFFTRGSSSPS